MNKYFKLFTGEMEEACHEYRTTSDMQKLRYWYTTYTDEGRNNKLIGIQAFLGEEDDILRN